MQDTVTIAYMRDALAQNQAIVFDVREPDEHATGVIAQAQLLPMSAMPERMHEIPKDRTVLLICRTHNRSATMVRLLRDNGWSDVRYVLDGMKSWAEQGLPMVQP